MRTLKGTLRMQWEFHFLLIPAIVLIAIFNYFPLYGLIIAFQRYNPGLGYLSPWVGGENFAYVFGQPNFVRTISNTVFIAMLKIVFGIIIPVTFALLLNEVEGRTAKRSFQTVVYMPHFLSWVILAGVMIEILGRDGIINLTLKNLFGTGPFSFLGDPGLFPWTMVVSDIWKNFGFGTVIYLAALTSIDPGLYESAVVDGASRWKQTTYITIPMLMPTIVLMTILSLGNVLNAGFDQIYNLYSPGVYATGDIIDTYVYRLGIEQAQYSVATAVGMFKSAVSAVMILTSYYLADRFAGYRVF